MRICVISDALVADQAAGAEYSVLNICECLRLRGHEIKIITATPEISKAKLERLTAKFEVEVVSSSKLDTWHDYTLAFRPFISTEIARRAMNFKPDILQVHLIHNFSSLEVIKKLKVMLPSAPLVLTIHDYSLLCKGALRCKYGEGKGNPADLQLPSRLRCMVCQKGTFNLLKPKLTMDILNKYCDAVVFVSAYIQRFFLINGLKNCTKVFYNGAHQSGSERPFRMRSQKNFVAIAGGRMVERKGYLKLLEAFLELKKRSNLPLKLLLYGNVNDFYRRLQSFVFTNKLTEQVKFLGWLDQTSIQELINEADFGIVPSLYPDPLPRTLFDYGIAGLPIIASNLGGSPEISENGAFFSLYESFSKEELAQSMFNMMENYDGAMQRAKAFAWKIQQDYTVECNADLREQLYTSLLTRNLHCK